MTSFNGNKGREWLQEVNESRVEKEEHTMGTCDLDLTLNGKNG